MKVESKVHIYQIDGVDTVIGDEKFLHDNSHSNFGDLATPEKIFEWFYSKLTGHK